MTERPPRPVDSRSKRQSKTRSLNVDHRVKMARKKFYSNLPDRATKEWNRTYDRIGLSQGQWEERWISERKAEWEADMPARLKKIQAKITREKKERGDNDPKPTDDVKDGDSDHTDEDAAEDKVNDNIHDVLPIVSTMIFCQMIK